MKYSGLNKELTALESAGIIETAYSQMTIRDIARLQAAAGEVPDGETV